MSTAAQPIKPQAVRTTATAPAIGTLQPYSAYSRADTVGVTNGSATVTDLSITSVDQGRPVSGAGIPANSYVGTVTANTSFLLSSSPSSQVNVTATATSSVTATIGVGPIAPPLPALSGITRDGAIVSLEKDVADVSTNAVTVTCAGGDTFASGATTVPLAVPGERIELQSATIGGARVWKTLRHTMPASQERQVATSTKLRGDARLQSMAATAPTSPPVMSSPPTVTESTTATGANTQVLSQYRTDVFRFDGPTVSSSSGTTPRYYTNADGSGVAASVNTTQMFFDTDADSFDFVIYGRTGIKYRIWVNEKLVSATWATLSITGSVNAYINVAFGSFSAIPRRIVIEVESSTFAIQIFGLRGKPTASFWPSSYIGPRALIVGDSYGAGVGSDMFANSYGRIMGRLLGWADTWSQFSSVGSTGLIKTLSATAGTYQSRIVGDVIAYQPDFVLIQGSINDSPYVGQGTIGPALALYVNTLRAACPNVVVHATGLLAPFGLNASYQSLNAELRVAALALGIPFHDFQSPQLFTGTGNSTTPASDGNADRYHNGSAVNHPTAAGHYAIASHLAAMIGKYVGVSGAAA